MCTHIHTHTQSACRGTCGYICRKDEAIPPKSLCSGLNAISQQAGQCALIFLRPRLLSLAWDVCWPRRSRCCRQMAGESPGNWRVIKGLLLQCRKNLQAQLPSSRLPPFPKARPGLKVLLHWKGRKWNWDGQFHTWHSPPINWLKSVQFNSACQTHLVKCRSAHCSLVLVQLHGVLAFSYICYHSTDIRSPGYLHFLKQMYLLYFWLYWVFVAMRVAFSSCGKWDLLSSCDAPAYLIAEHRLGSCGARA